MHEPTSISTGVIEGARVRLRPPIDSDLQSLKQMRNDTRLQTLLLADPKPNSDRDVRDWLHRRGSQPDAVFFVIAELESDCCAGFIQILGIRAGQGNGSLGIAVAEPFAGRGFATEAIALTESYAASRRGLRKVTLEVMLENERAVQLYERMQYRRVGVLHQHYRHDGQFHDVLIMEKLVAPSPAESSRLSAETA